MTRGLFHLVFGPVATYRCHMCKGVTRTDVRPRDVMGRRLAPCLSSPGTFHRCLPMTPRWAHPSCLLGSLPPYLCHQKRCRPTGRCSLWPLRCRQRRGDHADVGDTGAHGMEEVRPRDAAPLAPAKPEGRPHLIPEVRPPRLRESRTRQLSARPVSYRYLDLWIHKTAPGVRR